MHVCTFLLLLLLLLPDALVCSPSSPRRGAVRLVAFGHGRPLAWSSFPLKRAILEKRARRRGGKQRTTRAGERTMCRGARKDNANPSSLEEWRGEARLKGLCGTALCVIVVPAPGGPDYPDQHPLSGSPRYVWLLDNLHPPPPPTQPCIVHQPWLLATRRPSPVARRPTLSVHPGTLLSLPRCFLTDHRCRRFYSRNTQTNFNGIRLPHLLTTSA